LQKVEFLGKKGPDFYSSIASNPEDTVHSNYQISLL